MKAVVRIKTPISMKELYDLLSLLLQGYPDETKVYEANDCIVVDIGRDDR